MIRQRHHPRATVSVRRIEAFTDGVFAIAATLLVLGLTDKPIDGITTNDDLARALGALWHPVLTFAIAFIILCLMWRAHVEQFEHIARIDPVGVWINTIRLLFVVLVPFTSALNSDHGGLLLGAILLPVNFLAALVLGWLQWLWAARTGGIPDLSPAVARRAGRAGLSSVVIGLAVVLLSPFVGSWAFLLFFFDGVLTRALHGGELADPDGGDVEGRG